MTEVAVSVHRAAYKHWRWKPTYLTKRNRDGNSDRLRRIATTGRWPVNGDRGRAVDRRARQVVLYAVLHRGRVVRAQDDGVASAFARGVGQDLLDHDHPAVFDHPENQEEEHGRNDGELDYGCPPSILSAQPADFLHFRSAGRRELSRSSWPSAVIGQQLLLLDKGCVHTSIPAQKK